MIKAGTQKRQHFVDEGVNNKTTINNENIFFNDRSNSCLHHRFHDQHDRVGGLYDSIISETAEGGGHPNRRRRPMGSWRRRQRRWQNAQEVDSLSIIPESDGALNQQQKALVEEREREEEPLLLSDPLNQVDIFPLFLALSSIVYEQINRPLSAFFRAPFLAPGLAIHLAGLPPCRSTN